MTVSANSTLALQLRVDDTRIPCCPLFRNRPRQYGKVPDGLGVLVGLSCLQAHAVDCWWTNQQSHR